jgi:GNAT superfamily N-acetyltransferase
MIELIQPHSPEDWQAARHLIEAYAGSLSVDLAYQNLAHELDHLDTDYGPPTGAFLIARERGSDLGCVGVRQFSDAGEIKRLYVPPAARGRGLGRLLAQGIVLKAKSLGYRRLLLDTLPSMQEGLALYASMGFKPIAAYRHNPVAGTHFMELELA